MRMRVCGGLDWAGLVRGKLGADLYTVPIPPRHCVDPGWIVRARARRHRRHALGRPRPRGFQSASPPHVIIHDYKSLDSWADRRSPDIEHSG